jgi:hypothetical protein
MTCLLLASPGQPPGKPAVDTKVEAEQASAAAKRNAAEYVVRLGKSEKALRMEPEPILRWTNHIGRRFYGDVFVWTHEGRPEVVASVTSIFTEKTSTYTEIQSVSEGSPVLSRGEKVVWEPSSPGVEFKPLPGAAKPGSTPGARLLQLRALAGEFTVVADYGIDKDDKWTLRLHATPAFRYQSAGHGVLDGALFAFGKGTDPDAFLMIEARGKKDDPQWHYAFARFNGSCVLRATHKDKEAWKVDRLPGKTISDPKEPYFNFR